MDSFSVTNFRSINDSGKVDVAQITALLGRNESGKSNLLRALDSLNPAEGFEALNPIKDFPRHRRLEECNDRTKVVTSRWILDDEDKAELMAILPRAGGVTHVDIGRYYGAERWVSFIGLTAQGFNESDVKGKLRKIVPAVRAAADGLEEAKKAALEKAAHAFEEK